MFAPVAIIASFVAAVALLGAQSTSADWTADLSPCALKCATIAVNSTDCKLQDITCLCKSEKFITEFTDCVHENCPTFVDYTFVNITLPRLCDPKSWIWQLPDCVRDCAIKAAATVGCDLNDRQCLCNSQWLDYWLKCVDENCDRDGYEIAKHWYEGICDGTVAL